MRTPNLSFSGSAKLLPPKSFSTCNVLRWKRAALVAEQRAHVEVYQACGGDDQTQQGISPVKTCDCGTSYEWERKELERMYDQGEPCASTSSADAHYSSHGIVFGTQVVQQQRPWVTGAVQLGSDPEAPKEKSSKERHDDFYANVGDAIRTLREDVPTLFKTDLNYSIYRPDIVFRDPRNTFQGMDNYKLIFWSLRFHGRIFFKDLFVEVKRIWQKQDDSICLRWTVHGIPRLPWEAEGVFDGVSTYKLDSHGKIYEHKVDNVILRDPPMASNPLLIRLNLQAVVPQSQPCPGSWGCENRPQGNAPASFRTLYVAAIAALLLHTRQLALGLACSRTAATAPR